MKLLKPIPLILLLLTRCLIMQAQNDFNTEWSKVAAFEKKGLTKDALAVVQKIFSDASRAANQPQVVKAAMYEMKYRNMVQEDNAENNIFYLDTLIAKTPEPAKQILQSMQAEMFQAYQAQNRYRLYDRTALAQENESDIRTWSLEKLSAQTRALYNASLQNTALLQRTKIDSYDAILNKGQNTRQLRPTLYDFLAHRALQYFMSDENDITRPAYQFIINDEKVFAPIPAFVKTSFASKDTASLQHRALLLLQQLLLFHLQDANTDALLDADLIRLSFANAHGIFTNKSQLYEAALKDIEKEYASSHFAAEAMYLRAQEYMNRAEGFDPLRDTSGQWAKKRAKELCEATIKKYPKSEGAMSCKNLLIQIEMPLLNLQTEQVNVPGTAFRSLVTYSNVKTIYLRMVKTSRDELDALQSMQYENLWPAILKLNALKSWSVALPDAGDYQAHRAEIKIDALPSGTYMLLASLEPNFKLEQNIIARQVTYVSSISYIYNNMQQLYVLDRNSGSPLANAKVQVWQRVYDYSIRKYQKRKGLSFTADKNGQVLTSLPNENYNNYLQITHQGEDLFTDNAYYNYDYNSYNNRQETKRSFLFTDRSIYRPGQTVFFKGIMIATDTTKRNSRLVTGQSTTVILYDVNHQKQGSVQLTTNAFGSVSGSFVLPQGLLTGQFFIRDSITNSQQFFSVEEYKRPKFITEIKKPEGTYRVNDSITVKGNAKAYAGNNIDAAKVRYRVVRQVQYPLWWGYSRIWPPYGSREAMEITNGETVTDAQGNFEITFKAIPDETADKKNQPTFYYEVNADVTDLNGETRSAKTTVAVAYQALQLQINAAEKLAADSLHTIQIFSRNMNGLFEKATVHVELYALQQPSQMFRSRYWPQPDQFTMTKEAYHAAFPYDAYADEGNKATWALGKKIADMRDTTSANGKFGIEAKPSAGWYKIIVTTTDKYGETVRTESFVQIFDEKLPAGDMPLSIAVKDKIAAPGQTTRATYYTGFDKIWMISTVSRADGKPMNSMAQMTASRPFEQDIKIAEADRGGVQLGYAFVKNNRVYSGGDFVAVPWTNKALQISYETFRDKILPGSEERWTVKISGAATDKVSAEMLVNMYDASLDQFKPHNWNLLSSIWPMNNRALSWMNHDFKAVNSEEQNNFSRDYTQAQPKYYDGLMQNGWNDIVGRIRYKMAVRSAAPSEESMADASASKIALGRETKIRLRGQNEIPANAALYVIDGVIAASAKDVDPDDVKTMEVLSAAAATALYGAKGANGAIVITTISGKGGAGNAKQNDIKIRKNFNETAFFFPQLQTDATGSVHFSFTIPEALTEWKLMTMAHDKNLASGYTEHKVITQKPLMVQPNAPRFLREGDKMELVTKVVNLSDKEITGTAQLELLDAGTNTPVDGWFQNVFPNQYFTVEAGQSVAVKFPMAVPFKFNSALTYRIKAISKAPAGGAADGEFSDGEEAALPVLSNRMLVTETFPINMRTAGTKQFVFEKLLQSQAAGDAGNSTLTHHALTVEYTANPVWYAVQALPYLMEYPYECAEQNFNRYYANVLAAYVANSTPKIKAIFEQWKTLDTAALLSKLQKNEELKTALLEETPWVLQAKNENEQKKNIAILFDMVRLAREKESTLKKLKEMQSSNGGFTWFKGGPDDRFITQYIITGIGHLRKLSALSATDEAALQPILAKAIPYLDARLKDEYDMLLKNKVKLADNHLSYTAVQYGYMRSFFGHLPIAATARTAANYFEAQAKKYWLSQSQYMQGMIALGQWRRQDAGTAKAIIASLKQNAITSEEFGMYWKAFNTGGYYWYQAPVESHALMVEAFSEIDGNSSIVNDLKTWLLKQKQTQNWRTTKATAEACYALLIPQKGQTISVLSAQNKVQISLGDMLLPSPASAEAGTGYFKQTITAEKIKPGMGNIKVDVRSANPAQPLSAGWGALYWQYFEDLDKITPAATPLSLQKKLYVEKNTATGPVLTAIKDGDALHVGDKVKVRIELRADRNMEYVHMKDMRAASMEPVNVLSQYKWQGGLGYYESTKDASTNFFFSWLPRGTYVFEYSLFVSHAGNFSNGITTIQCMYAPEFSSHSEGIRVDVEQ